MLKRFILLALLFSSNAYAAGFLNYLKGYQLGLTYSSTGDNIVLNYDTDVQNPIPSKC